MMKKGWLWLALFLTPGLGFQANRLTWKQWRPLVKSALYTHDFHSPCAWVPVVRTADRCRGYLVYAPSDQVPRDWPTTWNVADEHLLGFWQFVLTDASVEPNYSGVREDNSCPVFDDNPYCSGIMQTLETFFWRDGPNNEIPPAFERT